VADKFGDVLVAPTRPPTGGAPQAPSSAPTAAPKLVPGAATGTVQQPAVMLGHLCSIISSLATTGDGRYLVSTDKESKVRVSVLPDQPLKVGGTRRGSQLPSSPQNELPGSRLPSRRQACCISAPCSPSFGQPGWWTRIVRLQHAGGGDSAGGA
jgi:hypothetical protein